MTIRTTFPSCSCNPEASGFDIGRKAPVRLAGTKTASIQANRRAAAVCKLSAIMGRMATLGCIFAVLIAGCATSNGRHYTYHTMPSDLLVKKRDNVQTLDLTQLARLTNDSDVIDKGDIIKVSISAGLDEKDTITLPVRVNERGIANIPEVGPIPLAGLEMQTAENVIVQACIDRQLYRNPNVTVTMERQRTNRVTVVGAVKNPNVYELPRGRSDLLTAIVAAGGLDDDAGTNVEIRNPRRNKSRPAAIASGLAPGVNPAGHSNNLNGIDPTTQDATTVGVAGDSAGGMESITVDLVSATKSKTGDYQIEDGGVVRIEKRDPEALHVIGLVKKPDSYKFPINDDLRVTDAIALAGGTYMTLADKVFVIRKVPNTSETAVIQVSLREAKRNAQANVRLEPGDVVSVESTPATVIYEALNIIRFNFSTGLTVPAAGIF